MYHIIVEKDTNGNIIFVSCEKDGITVEFGQEALKPYLDDVLLLEDIIAEFEATIKQGEALND